MKKILYLLIFYFITGSALGQMTLLIEKIGTPRKYYYHTGDFLKLRVSPQDTLLKGKLWSISDSMISVSELRPFDVRLGDIRAVYKQYYYPKKFGRIIGTGGIAAFAIIAFNHLINNEPVFSPDVFIVSGALLGASLISFSLSEKKCRIGQRWKIKVLDIKVN